MAPKIREQIVDPDREIGSRACYFHLKSVPKKSIHGSSDIYLGTQWKQRHDSPWSYRSDVIVTFLWYGTIGIIWHRGHQSTAKEV